ncbi:MAG: UDP-N-acetylmuramoyl-tripeptide--D-alanyl-D-alanine ligase [bacterium ADurb.Bin212]|nr:MAG: UDP-N-acetylmuramoyl-tripeptide--D-alanyl-D-alanine ligase [bacterium ADurb.Bin212]
MKQLILKIIYKRLADVAKAVINKHQPVVIAITGSVGKTSAKEALVQIMRDKFADEVRFTKGNLNAEIGIPLTILGYGELPSKKKWPAFLLKISKHLKEENFPKYLILEMGVERPGDIEYFCSIARPTFAVITAATPAHLANFSSEDEMKKEKQKLAGYVGKDKLFYNCDDEYLSDNITSGCSYGIHNINSMICASNIELSLDGNSYTLSLGDKKINIKNGQIGEQMIYADIAAAGVADAIGVTAKEIADSLNKRKSYNGRMNLLPGKNNVLIIDDSYNANPASVLAAATTLHNLKYNGRKILVLGNMNELGSESEIIHIETARMISDLSELDSIYFIGPNSQKMLEAVKGDNRVVIYKTRQDFEKHLNENILPGDLVLIKASQNNNYFEELVKIMLKEGVDPKDVLVRQSDDWLSKK